LTPFLTGLLQTKVGLTLLSGLGSEALKAIPAVWPHSAGVVPIQIILFGFFIFKLVF
tara:strand:- start:396 stop:566 length:171 start_codon:yes stop_codon:yes gene_type:complete